MAVNEVNCFGSLPIEWVKPVEETESPVKAIHTILNKVPPRLLQYIFIMTSTL